MSSGKEAVRNVGVAVGPKPVPNNGTGEAAPSAETGTIVNAGGDTVSRDPHEQNPAQLSPSKGSSGLPKDKLDEEGGLDQAPQNAASADQSTPETNTSAENDLASSKMDKQVEELRALLEAAEERAKGDRTSASNAAAAQKELMLSLKEQTRARRKVEADLASARRALEASDIAKRTAETERDAVAAAAEEEKRALIKQHKEQMRRMENEFHERAYSIAEAAQAEKRKVRIEREAAVTDLKREISITKEALWKERDRRQSLEQQLEGMRCKQGESATEKHFESERRASNQAIRALQQEHEVRMEEMAEQLMHERRALRSAHASILELRQQLYNEQTMTKRAASFIDHVTLHTGKDRFDKESAPPTPGEALKPPSARQVEAAAGAELQLGPKQLTQDHANSSDNPHTSEHQAKRRKGPLGMDVSMAGALSSGMGPFPMYAVQRMPVSGVMDPYPWNSPLVRSRAPAEAARKSASQWSDPATCLQLRQEHLSTKQSDPSAFHWGMHKDLGRPHRPYIDVGHGTRQHP
uniref:Uncharacterized protein n=1 Tax=Tetraselmis sp. GSL018 TaxID=582737 RepID=A0A061R9F5_9CHLO|mmetsp:Transcript_22406/g.53553  ORF Transcript_22406/g.53553 Transcript_22406/m.53553 type:complete len:525 (-) Transcript_22406:72-1646(-)|eukprot:CAMPEP_0177592096 /NCGR_PEP_ID=MMETSP0419_2-20121207/8365_1 /TAXON_ID=582737 /ORGANISM="Tetraselmis sp., Strain GSL018" /LENGTH=524 /DNA_ID=CAMNT_0019082915 /DNA_START=215 /DNA_END=1789 /DNA_ORIENTATION=+